MAWSLQLTVFIILLYPTSPLACIIILLNLISQAIFYAVITTNVPRAFVMTTAQCAKQILA